MEVRRSELDKYITFITASILLIGKYAVASCTRLKLLPNAHSFSYIIAKRGVYRSNI